jgi:hypothetical protein
MNNHAEANQRPICKATTKAGRPCRKLAVEDGFCLFHSGKLDLAEQGRRGGKASGEARSRKQQPERPGDRLEGLAHTALEELLASSGNATARAAAARLVIDKLAAHSPLNAELAHRAASEAIRQQMEADMPRVREKVSLLLERKAQALAREMYRARIKLETEAVKAEMTTEASTESAREDALTRERAEEASFVIDEAARLWAASGLLPVDVDERKVLRGLFELGLIAPGHKWQAQAEEEPPAADENADLADSTEPLPDPIEEDWTRQIEEEQARQEAERIARELDPPPES